MNLANIKLNAFALRFFQRRLHFKWFFQRKHAKLCSFYEKSAGKMYAEMMRKQYFPEPEGGGKAITYDLTKSPFF